MVAPEWWRQLSARPHERIDHFHSPITGREPANERASELARQPPWPRSNPSGWICFYRPLIGWPARWLAGWLSAGRDIFVITKKPSACCSCQPAEHRCVVLLNSDAAAADEMRRPSSSSNAIDALQVVVAALTMINTRASFGRFAQVCLASVARSAGRPAGTQMRLARVCRPLRHTRPVRVFGHARARTLVALA